MTEVVDVLTSTVNAWNDESTGHRAKDHQTQRFSVTHRETGFHVWCHHSSTEKGSGSPRHRHNFEQIRYVLEGHINYGKKKYGPGTFIYVPESVYYGPQTRDDEATRVLLLQFPGPSGVPKFNTEEIREGQNRLCAQGVVFQKGIAHFPSGKKQDAAEAIWECLAGRPIEYAPPRYEAPIYVYSQVFPLQSTGRDGVGVKHLGYFNECGPNVSLLHLQPGASVPGSSVSWLEMRIVIEGEVEYAGQHCRAISRIYCPPGGSYDELVSRSGATLFIFQTAVPGGEAPRR
jgi:quercetin dioxygenase-like cupin family protein